MFMPLNGMTNLFSNISFQTHSDLSSLYLILWGDFNCWLNPQLDRFSSNFSPLSKSSKVILLFKKEFCLWCLVISQLFFFYHVYHTFTNVDYFLVDNRLIPNVADCRYEAIVLADHAPVCLNIHGGVKQQHISLQIDFFFISVNKTPDVSAAVLWESLKADIWGGNHFMYERKLRLKSFLHWQSEYLSLIIYMPHPRPQIYRAPVFTIRVWYSYDSAHHWTSA